MTFEQSIIASVVGVLSAAIIAGIAVYSSKRWGAGTLAKEVNEQESKLIAALRGRIETLDDRVAEATALAEDTERKRQACEMEIIRVRRALTMTEGELLDLYRKTGKVPPKDLIVRHADHSQEET